MVGKTRIIALIIQIVFRLVKIQSHDENQCLSFFNERKGTTSFFPMCLFLDFMRAASVLSRVKTRDPLQKKARRNKIYFQLNMIVNFKFKRNSERYPILIV